MISVKRLKVQLPGSDDQFLFVRDITTNFLDKPARVDEFINDDNYRALVFSSNFIVLRAKTTKVQGRKI
jgi:hypothetical protein